MDMSLFPYFLVSSILLTMTPGPDNLYLLAKSIADGARAGIILAAGLASGIVFHTCLVILGVAALVKSSPIAFAALKYVGAAYLFYLAYGAFTAKVAEPQPTETAAGQATRQTAYQAMKHPAKLQAINRQANLQTVSHPPLPSIVKVSL